MLIIDRDERKSVDVLDAGSRIDSGGDPFEWGHEISGQSMVVAEECLGMCRKRTCNQQIRQVCRQGENPIVFEEHDGLRGGFACESDVRFGADDIRRDAVERDLVDRVEESQAESRAEELGQRLVNLPFEDDAAVDSGSQ